MMASVIKKQSISNSDISFFDSSGSGNIEVEKVAAEERKSQDQIPEESDEQIQEKTPPR